MSSIQTWTAAPTYTWATLPAAGTAGRQAFVSNAGTKGSFWYDDGTRWKPLNGSVVLSTLDSASSNIGSTETIVHQYQIPAGLWQTGDRIRFEGYMEKSGTTDTGIWYLRIGTGGTTADTVLINGLTWLAAGNLSGSFFVDYRLETATTVQQTSASFGFTVAGSAPTPVTISSATSNALYLSVGIKSGGATNTVLMRDSFMQMIAKAN